MCISHSACIGDTSVKLISPHNPCCDAVHSGPMHQDLFTRFAPMGNKCLYELHQISGLTSYDYSSFSLYKIEPQNGSSNKPQVKLLVLDEIDFSVGYPFPHDLDSTTDWGTPES